MADDVTSTLVTNVESSRLVFILFVLIIDLGRKNNTVRPIKILLGIHQVSIFIVTKPNAVK